MGVLLILAIPLVAAIGLIVLLLKLLRKPIKWAFKLLLHALFGFVFLFIFNFFGSIVGITLGFNWLNAIVTGVLGIPGVILLLLLTYIF